MTEVINTVYTFYIKYILQYFVIYEDIITIKKLIYHIISCFIKKSTRII